MTSSHTAAPTAAAPDFWDRTRRGWHAIFYALLAVMAVLVPGLDDTTQTERGVVLGALAVMGVSYTLAGRRALGWDDTRLALLYLVPAWACVLAIVAVDPVGYLLLFVLFPQTWAMLPRTWQAVTWTLLASALLGLTQLWQVGFSRDAATDAVLTFVFNAGLSLLLGLWITGIVRESERRAELIAELQQTRVELASVERSRGALEERERLAREIHDTLAQGFTSILALAQAIDAGWDHDPAAARSRLGLLEQTARENLTEARALVAALGPVDLQQGSLQAALHRVVERFTLEAGVPTDLVVDGEPAPLGANAEVVLLRSAQEALANVRKHAHARHARVRLAYADGGATLEVEDDGVGIGADTSEGFGMRGMRDRAAHVGGQLQVARRDGGGTRVHVRVG